MSVLESADWDGRNPSGFPRGTPPEENESQSRTVAGEVPSARALTSFDGASAQSQSMVRLIQTPSTCRSLHERSKLVLWEGQVSKSEISPENRIRLIALPRFRHARSKQGASLAVRPRTGRREPGARLSHGLAGLRLIMEIGGRALPSMDFARDSRLRYRPCGDPDDGPANSICLAVSLHSPGKGCGDSGTGPLRHRSAARSIRPALHPAPLVGR